MCGSGQPGRISTENHPSTERHPDPTRSTVKRNPDGTAGPRAGGPGGGLVGAVFWDVMIFRSKGVDAVLVPGTVGVKRESLGFVRRVGNLHQPPFSAQDFPTHHSLHCDHVSSHRASSKFKLNIGTTRYRQ